MRVYNSLNLTINQPRRSCKRIPFIKAIFVGATHAPHSNEEPRVASDTTAGHLLVNIRYGAERSNEVMNSLKQVI